MDIGMVFIRVQGGTALVVRCEEDGEGAQLVPAPNAAELTDETARVVAELGGALDDDGLYICTNELQAAAQFPLLALPGDALSIGEAGSVLYPEASRSERWERLAALRNAGALRVYRVGNVRGDQAVRLTGGSTAAGRTSRRVAAGEGCANEGVRCLWTSA